MQAYSEYSDQAKDAKDKSDWQNRLTAQQGVIQQKQENLIKRNIESDAKFEKARREQLKANEAAGILAVKNARVSQLQSQLTQILMRDEALRTRDYNKNLALRNQLSEASHSLRNLNATLYGFERTLNPIKDPKIDFRVDIPLQDPSLKEYRIALEAEATRYLTENKRSYANNPTDANIGAENSKSKIFQNEIFEVYKDKKGGGNRIKTVLEIRRGTFLFPNRESKDNDPTVKLLLAYQPQLSFFARGRFTPNRFSLLPANNADLLITSNVSFATTRLMYSVTTKRLSLEYSGVILAYLIKQTGRIVSLPDLKGARVQVMRQNFETVEDEPLRERILSLERRVRFSSLGIELSETQRQIGSEEIVHYWNDISGDVAIFDYDAMSQGSPVLRYEYGIDQRK